MRRAWRLRCWGSRVDSLVSSHAFWGIGKRWTCTKKCTSPAFLFFGVLLGVLCGFCFACFSFCFGFCAEGFEAALLGFADSADCFVVGLKPLGDDGGEQAAVLVFLFLGAFFGVVEVDGEEFLRAGEVYVVVEGDEGVGGVFSVVHVDDG